MSERQLRHGGKCHLCFYRRLIISENGAHYICSLSDSKAIKCMFGEKDSFVGFDLKVEDTKVEE